MTDKESTPKSKKRVVGINTAIALIIVVVLLAAVLGYSMYYYTAEINSKNNTLSSMNNELNSKNSTIQSLNSQINTLNSEISSLNNQIANLKAQLNTSNSTIQSLNSQINTLNSEISSLNNQIANLKAQLNTSNSTIANLQEILSLNGTTVEISDQTISQPAGYYTYWTLSIPYAGYIVVEVLSSTSTNTYAIVSWSSYGVSYSHSVTVGSSGTVNFPVLPSSNVVVGVGNSDLIIGATETVTILYYY
jgi:prefoldin subunit 5